VTHINLGSDETRLPFSGLKTLLTLPKRLGADVALLPAYFHWSLILNMGTRLAGGRVVMMNDTHAGTARARGLKMAFKRRIVSSFHAGFVAGAPQKRYFSSLGLSADKIVTGYDAVDNDYFASRTDEVKREAPALRSHYDLPEHYFLNLGRFVAKKNLGTLIRAYRLFLDASERKETHLVLVGSGEEESKLRTLCGELRLPIYDHPPGSLKKYNAVAAGVHFYGFRQIDESPIFYGLADAFILPSFYEEWGLVVNEAMACGLPVIVSRTAGCAEDLLETGVPGESLNGEAAAIGQLRLESLVRQNGFVFEPESTEELSRVMRCLAENPKFGLRMGTESRRIVEKFSCQNFAKNALQAARLAIQ
jgi:glycosyltransferase involved in cell wall biosynthesis